LLRADSPPGVERRTVIGRYLPFGFRQEIFIWIRSFLARSEASTLAIVAGGPAAANVNAVPSLNPAQSFAELLDPIPNAAETLASMDENAPQKLKQAGIQLAQYHHHHHHYRRHHHHHHHHHHHYY
jgi:hypothetical protein